MQSVCVTKNCSIFSTLKLKYLADSYRIILGHVRVRCLPKVNKAGFTDLWLRTPVTQDVCDHYLFILLFYYSVGNHSTSFIQLLDL